MGSLFARLALGGGTRVRSKSAQGISLQDIIFSDEKMFRLTGDPGASTQNRRAWLDAKESKRKLLADGSTRVRLTKTSGIGRGLMASCAIGLRVGVLGPNWIEKDCS